MTPARRRTGLVAPVLLAGALLVAACTAAPPAPTAPTPTPVGSTRTPAPVTPTISSTPAASVPATVSEPTTTNTLPPPPEPSAPAPSTAGPLSAVSLPVPAGWRTVALPGGDEEGYLGNGTWVHARDPRYAAQDVITLGCADVTRDDYADPVAALEGRYRRGSRSGVGLVLAFGDEADATRYLARYRDQVQACTSPGADVATTVLAQPRAADGGDGLVDRRRYPDGDWTEVVERNGARLTLLVLEDPGQRITRAQAAAVLAQIHP